MKSIPKSRQLKNALGGSWKYDGRTTWWDQDSKEHRHVSRVAACSCEDHCPHSPRFYLYNDGDPKMVIFGVNEVMFL